MILCEIKLTGNMSNLINCLAHCLTICKGGVEYLVLFLNRIDVRVPGENMYGST